jgi:hypothetical protein
MRRDNNKRRKFTRTFSSFIEPHELAHRINHIAVQSWVEGDLKSAISSQKEAIHIKENRGDLDLEQYREELIIMEEMEEEESKFHTQVGAE